MFEPDPFLVVARGEPFWIACLVSTPVWGFLGSRFRSVKEPLSAGFLIFSGGIAGLATVQPDDDRNARVFAGLAGVGFGALIILIVAAVQLSTPHHLIATATAITVSSRSVAAAAFTAIYVAAFSERLKARLPSYVAAAAAKAGLPPASLQAFVAALAGNDQEALLQVPGVTVEIISVGVAALKNAYADSIRVVFMIAAPFGVAAAISCWFLADMKATMNYRVDAPVETLKTKVHQGNTADHATV